MGFSGAGLDRPSPRWRDAITAAGSLSRLSTIVMPVVAS
jgi:hypothetical protein